MDFARPLALSAVSIGCLVGCASQGLPPGGPPDTAAPKLVAVLPESGSVSVTPRVVEFRFDEVVSERPRGAPSLEQLVVISPSTGKTQVDWGRNRIVVRPGTGWKPNTAYTVTVLPGLSDLRANSATRGFRTIFSTGATIPSSALRGVAFDWMAGRAAPGARIEATTGGDTLLKWSIAADSSGRYSLTSLPPGQFLVRAYVDANNNGALDSREAWDSATVTISDSARTDFYAFPHDTLGARMSEVTIADSLTLRLRFDRGLRPVFPLEGATFRVVRGRDSTEIPIARAGPAAAFDSLAREAAKAREDSVARADTSAAGRARRAREDSLRLRRQTDSIAAAQQASLRAARDTVTKELPPVMQRAVPPTEFVVVLQQPLPLDSPVRVFAQNVMSISGRRASSDRQVTRRRPAPADSTTRRPPATAAPSPTRPPQ